jgi:hypothetical protein
MYEGALTNDFQILDSPRRALVSAAEAKFQDSNPPTDGQQPIGKNYTL